MRWMLVLLAVLAGCGGAVASDESTDDIEVGTADPGHPAVGLLRIEGGATCTATLIAPHVALTAGRCLSGKATAFYTGGGRIGATRFMVRHAIDAQAVNRTASSGACPDAGGDIGLVHLTWPITDIAPAWVSNPPNLGESCVAVGFGARGNTSGTKRRATMTVTAILPTLLGVRAPGAYPGLPAAGDLGGPLVCGNAIVGVGSCPGARDGWWYSRIDAIWSFIDSTMSAWSRCDQEGENPCPFGYVCVAGICQPPG